MSPHRVWKDFVAKLCLGGKCLSSLSTSVSSALLSAGRVISSFLKLSSLCKITPDAKRNFKGKKLPGLFICFRF